MTGMLQDLKEVLADIITDSSKVFIVGHNEPDFDSIGSAIALSEICGVFGRESYIVISDPNILLEPGVKRIVDESRGIYNIIDLNTFERLVDQNSSLIITDTNKEKLVSVRDYLPEFKYTMIIDHHKEDDNTIDADYKFISMKVSSASEIVAKVLNSYRLKYDSRLASYLLAGIELDTKHFQTNTFPKTHGVAEELLSRGASRSYVNSLFLADFETDRRIHDLVFNGSLFQTYEQSLFKKKKVGFVLNRKCPDFIYRKEDLAKSADMLLNYDVDASFAIGYVDRGVVSVSARSRNSIDVGDIMGRLGGGGNAFSGACRIVGKTPCEVEGDLRKIVDSSIMPFPSITDVSVEAPVVKSLVKVNPEAQI